MPPIFLWDDGSRVTGSRQARRELRRKQCRPRPPCGSRKSKARGRGLKHTLRRRRARDCIALSGDQRGGDRSVIASRHRADALVERVTQPVDDAGVTQPEALRHQRRLDLDRTKCVAGGADALKIHVARKLVSAGAKRLQRRRQMSLELDEAADCRRGPLAHGDTDALWCRCNARGLKALNADRDPVAALALFANLDKSGHQRARDWMLQDWVPKAECL